MSNTTDYWVSAVQYDTNNNHIVKVRAHKSNGTKMDPPEILSRETVISKIGLGVNFTTMFFQEGEWVRGQPIVVVSIGSKKFIKTTKNNVEKDNLDELPIF